MLAAAAALLSACEEWQPVFTGKYSTPEAVAPITDADMLGYGPQLSIRELCSMYKHSPILLQDGWIKGQVISSDASGNIYRSLYIQDETGGIEIKTGRTNSAVEYKLGQWIYVKLGGLSLGMYGFKTGNYGGEGMIQLGWADQSGEYETAYIDLPNLVDEHIFKGEVGTPVLPAKLAVSDLPGKNDTQSTNKYIGTYVELDGLKYGNGIFALLYLTYSEDTKLATNRIFLSDSTDVKDSKTKIPRTWGVTTWALTKERMKTMLENGDWDNAVVGSGNDKYETVGEHRSRAGVYGATYGDIERNAYSVSQYFKMGTKDIQVRTSGYARFADTQIDPDILSGAASVNMKGILTMYQGSVQFTLIDLEGVNKQ